MTMADPWWWPYAMIVVAGWLATDVWRWLGVLFSGRLRDAEPIHLPAGGRDLITLEEFVARALEVVVHDKHDNRTVHASGENYAPIKQARGT